jgi:hypothetical protein
MKGVPNAVGSLRIVWQEAGDTLSSRHVSLCDVKACS